ncbi:uncharacterized protein CDAR_20891 [Caerostris darwini]|uniref:Uncharacterized protein n=1 Tax=Caerostris darwini TaxID=1538125 RepID=A0AAV4MYG5_9ARAC|nr:uncharacterized protein CDAR_20891 [Caerostris darwini]
MRSSRPSSSALSSVSSRTYVSDRSRQRTHSSRHSLDSDISARKPNRKMKFIIVIGIALPIVAAIIGVVAWAVSADSAFRSPAANSLRRSDANIDHEEDIFQILEDRHDLSYTRHPGSYTQEDQDLSRVDKVQNMHQNNFDDNPEKDPLYIVHFVPSPKPKVESSTSVPNAASTVSSEVLKKILSASKGAKPGTPQFVVFAPVPSEEEKRKGNDLTGLGASGMNFISRPPTPNVELDYDYEDELRKYQELLDSKDKANLKDNSNGATTEESRNSQQPQPPRSAGSDIGLLASEFNQQPIQRQSRPQQVSQTYSQNPQAVYSEATQSNYPHQSHNRQDPVQNPVEANFNQMQHNYNQAQSNYQQPQQQISNYPNQQLPYPGQQQQPPAAMDRSGHFPPLGISLSLGNGGHGGHGKGLLGGHSPLGIISSVLSPIIKKPRVNLNGKLMFGVMLEKGVKFGDDKGHHHHGK